MKHPGRISGGNLTLAGLVVVSIGVVPVNAASFKTNSIEGWRVPASQRAVGRQ